MRSNGTIVPNDVSNELTGGKIGAWLDLRDSIIPQYEANLNELAGTIVKEVNTQHLAGYALDNSTNHYFFNPFNIGPAQYDATWTGDKMVTVRRRLYRRCDEDLQLCDPWVGSRRHRFLHRRLE